MKCGTHVHFTFRAAEFQASQGAIRRRRHEEAATREASAAAVVDGPGDLALEILAGHDPVDESVLE